MRRSFIFTGGIVDSYNNLPIKPDDSDLIICADSGINHCIASKIKPHIWVGDFDSSDFEAFENSELLKDTKIVRLSPCKDDTDTEHALHIAMDMGFSDVVIVGGFGGRLDHTMANAFLAEEAYNFGVTLTVEDDKNVLHYLKNDTLHLKKSRLKYISVIPIEDSLVSCTGFLYPLTNEKLRRGPARGVSNELENDEGFITIHKGCAFIVESMD